MTGKKPAKCRFVVGSAMCELSMVVRETLSSCFFSSQILKPCFITSRIHFRSVIFCYACMQNCNFPPTGSSGRFVGAVVSVASEVGSV